MGLEDKPLWELDLKLIFLKEDTTCRGCSTHLKKGQNVIECNDEKLRGVYCKAVCLESYILKSVIDEEIREFYSKNGDPVAKKVLRELGIKWNL